MTTQFTVFLFGDDKVSAKAAAGGGDGFATKWLTVDFPDSSVILHTSVTKMLALGAEITATATALRTRLMERATKEAEADGLVRHGYGFVRIKKHANEDGSIETDLADSTGALLYARYNLPPAVFAKLCETPNGFVQVFVEPKVEHLARPAVTRICVDGSRVYEAPGEEELCEECSRPGPVSSMRTIGILRLCPACQEELAQAPPDEQERCDTCNMLHPVCDLQRVGEHDDILDLCPNCAEERARHRQS